MTLSEGASAGWLATRWRRTSRIASASPPPHPCPGSGGSRIPRSASISTVVVPAGRPPRKIQRRSPYYSGSQLGAAVAFNSVLSIPYALDRIEKGLTAR